MITSPAQATSKLSISSNSKQEVISKLEKIHNVKNFNSVVVSGSDDAAVKQAVVGFPSYKAQPLKKC